MDQGEAVGSAENFADLPEGGMEIPPVKKVCPVCDEQFINASCVTGGRPRVYCSVSCRRVAERKRQREREAQRWAARPVSLDPDMTCLRDMAIDHEEFEKLMVNAGLLKEVT